CACPPRPPRCASAGMRGSSSQGSPCRHTTRRKQRLGAPRFGKLAPVRVLAIVHQRDSGPGVFGETIHEAGARLEEWAPAERAEPPADPLGYDAVLTLGGGMNVDEEDRHPWLADERALLEELIARGVPLLGLCLGGQLVAEAAGAEPCRAARPEIGWCELELMPRGRDDPLLGCLERRFEAFEWHSYEFPLPPGAVPLVRN